MSVDTYDLKQARFHTLTGIVSPETLITFNNAIYLGAGLDDPRPGVYRIQTLQDANAMPVVYAPQFDTTAFYVAADQLVVVAARVFSPIQRDWTAQQAVVNLETGELGPLEKLPIPSDCYNGKHGCGLSAVLRLADDHFLTVRQQQLARINTWRVASETWNRQRDFSVGLKRRSNRIVAAALIDDTFYFLLQDRWQLAKAKSIDILETYTSYIDLEIVLDFSDLQNRLKQRTRAIGIERLPTAFTWDAKGNLWVLLNPKGFVLEIDEQRESRSPQWLEIPRKATAN